MKVTIDGSGNITAESDLLVGAGVISFPVNRSGLPNFPTGYSVTGSAPTRSLIGPASASSAAGFIGGANAGGVIAVEENAAPATVTSPLGRVALTITAANAATQKLDFSAGALFDIALQANWALDTAGVAGLVAGQPYDAIGVFTQDATGGRTVAWPPGFDLLGGPSSVIRLAPNARTPVRFISADGVNVLVVPDVAGLAGVYYMDANAGVDTAALLTTDQEVHHLTIPAGLLPAKSVGRYMVSGTVINNSGGAVNLLPKVKLGATTVLDPGAAPVSVASAVGRRRFNLFVEVEVNATNDQIVLGKFSMSTNLATSPTWSQLSAAASVEGFNDAVTEDLTAAKDIGLYLNFGTAGAAGTIGFQYNSAVFLVLPRVS